MSIEHGPYIFPNGVALRCPVCQHDRFQKADVAFTSTRFEKPGGRIGMDVRTRFNVVSCQQCTATQMFLVDW